MKKGVNVVAIVTAVVAVGLIGTVAGLGIKAKQNSVPVAEQTEADTQYSDYNILPTQEETESSYYFEETQATDEPSTIQPESETALTEAPSTTVMESIVDKAQDITTTIVTTIAETTTVAPKKEKPSTTAAETTTKAVVQDGVTVPSLDEDEMAKGKTSISDITSAKTANSDLPDDMYFSGLRKLGYDVIGLKSYIFNNDTADNCMQRNLGYNVLYDAGANLIDFSIETARIKFNYNGKAYMVQMWKGQYISGDIGTVGGEVGIYTRDENATSAIGHYDCAGKEDWLNMELTIFWDEFDNGQYLPQFTRKYDVHWWETGYVDGQLKNRKDSSSLRILHRITFKDEAQAKAFEAAMIKEGFKSVSTFDPTVIDTVKRYGRDVIYLWQNVR